MTTPAGIARAWLISEGLVSDPELGGDWPLYNGRLPDDEENVEDDIGAIFNTPGILHGKDMSGTQYQHHGIQLRFRSVEPDDAYVKAQAVTDALLAMHRETVEIGSGESYLIHSFTQTSDIIPIQVDDKQRTHYTVNFIFAYSET